MRKIFTLVFFLITVVSHGQEVKEIALDWNKGSKIKWNGTEIQVPNFQVKNFSYNDEKKVLKFLDKISSGGAVDVNSFKLLELTSENLNSNGLGELDSKELEGGPDFKLRNINSAGELNVVLEFNPIYIEKGQIKKITRVKFTYEKSIESTLERAGSLQSYSSVLKIGVWKKFYIEKTGVYKVTKSFLKQLGVNVDVDPKTIKIYGFGGKMLPLKNKDNKYYDLPELRIQVVGEDDGVFDDSDYVLFYAEAMDNWSEENETHLNLYADKSYYYVTTGGDKGKRILDYVEPQGSLVKSYTEFDFYGYHEVDKVNLCDLGRKWVGEELHLSEKVSFSMNIPNLNLDASAFLKIVAVAANTKASNLNVNVNGVQVGNLGFESIPFLGSVRGDESTGVFEIKELKSNDLSISLLYQNNGNPSARSYLNYFSISSKAKLKGYGKQFGFVVKDILKYSGVCQYQFENVASVNQFWDVTDSFNVASLKKGNEISFSLKGEMGRLQKFQVVDESDYYLPKTDSNTSVVNQDLKGTVFLGSANNEAPLDYLIVCPRFLKSEAERLADFHRNYSKLTVKVVDLESIYNEFSSGKQDLGAIRNFVKYIYDVRPEGKPLKYLCLFGDASFDFKNRLKNNTNIVPIFQSLDSFSLSGSFATDEFFVCMDDDEGTLLQAEGSDIAVGRMLLNDLNQASQMVNKVIDYHDSKSKGKWRNRLVFLSDDVDKDTDATLEVNLNTMADDIVNKKPSLNVKKIFTDAYVQEITAGGAKYVKAKNDFLSALTEGALVATYIGHGSELGFAGERLFEITDAKALVNSYKFPLLVTVTCDFSRFDNPLKETGGEVAYKNPLGGAIGLITTTREVSQYLGEQFNLNVAPKLFAYDGNEEVSVAEVVRRTKVDLFPLSSYVISYLGDPAMKLALPKPMVKITKVNGVLLSEFDGALQALSKCKLEGEIVGENGQPQGNYNGEVFLDIFDKTIRKTTLANDGTKVGGVPFKMEFDVLGETVFRGNANVVNGKFEIVFVVPKDISMSVGTGKVSMYTKEQFNGEDKNGHELAIKIGGVNVNAPADTTPPVLKLFLNDKNFVSGTAVNQQPILLAEMYDENGINTAGGIGHDIVVILDGDESNPIILNEYYNSDKGDFTKGNIRYQFKKLSPGLHKIMVKVWDVYNNMVSSELEFIVIDDSDLVLTNVLNYPNPFVNYTEFWFTHNKPFEPLDVQVQVMTVTGKVVWAKNQTISTSGFISRDVIWDGKDDFGSRIGKGVYVYRLTVKSQISNKKAEKFEKLVIL